MYETRSLFPPNRRNRTSERRFDSLIIRTGILPYEPSAAKPGKCLMQCLRGMVPTSNVRLSPGIADARDLPKGHPEVPSRISRDPARDPSKYFRMTTEWTPLGPSISSVEPND